MVKILIVEDDSTIAFGVKYALEQEGFNVDIAKDLSLKSKDTTAMILVSEESRRMAEMKSQFAGMDFGMNFEEEKTLVINDNSPIIKKIVNLKDDESKKEQLSLICNQIVDVALLSNKELDSSELDEFIQRNNKLMSMVIDL